MRYNIVFDLASIIILLFVLFLFYTKPKWRAKYITWFLFIVYSILIATFFDILNVFVLEYTVNNRDFLFRLTKGFYLLFLNLTYLEFFMYCLKRHRFNKGSTYLDYALIPGLIIIISLFILVFIGDRLIINYGGNYEYTRLILITYIQEVIYFSFSIYLVFTSRLHKDRLEKFFFVLFILSQIFVVYIKRSQPFDMIMQFPIALIVLVLYFLIFTAERFTDDITKAYSVEAYQIATELYFTDKPGKQYVYIFDINNAIFNISDKGNEIINRVRHDFVRIIKLSFKAEVFMVSENRFSIYSYKDLSNVIKREFILNPVFIKSSKNNLIKVEPLIGNFIVPDDFNNQSEVLFASKDTSYLNVNAIKGIIKIQTDILSKIRTDLEIESQLRKSFTNNSSNLKFTPIYNTISKEVDGLIAINTYNYRNNKPISNADVIRVSTTSGIFDQLEETYIKNVSQFISESDICHSRVNNIFIYLNIDSFQIKNRAKKLLYLYKKNCNKTGFRLNIIFDTTPIIFNIDIVKENLNILTAVGVKFYLNNYGVANNNLKYILDYNFSGVKIGYYTMKTAVKNFKYYEVVKYILRLCEGMKLEVFADGIDSFESFKKFEQLNIKYFTGTYFGISISKEEFFESIDIANNLKKI